MKNFAVVAGVFVAGWTACLELKYSPQKDINTELEKRIATLESESKMRRRAVKLTPEYLLLQKEFNLSDYRLSELQRKNSELSEKLKSYSQALNASLTKGSLVKKIDELRKEKREIDENLRCEVDHCYGVSSTPKHVEQKVVDAYKKQSSDIQEQINLLIEQLSKET